MSDTAQLHDIPVRIVRKSIKHLHIRIVEPSLEVQLSVPRHMSSETAQALALSKYPWLVQRLDVLRRQHAELARTQAALGPTALVWGERCRLRVTTTSGRPFVHAHEDELEVAAKPQAPEAEIDRLVQQWYRSQIEEALVPLRTLWESRMQTRIGAIVLQRMKTRWGTCHSATRKIRLNIELAQKPMRFLEYVLVHEMVHFFEHNHGAGFQAAMGRHLPTWRELRRELDSFPRS